MPADPSPTSASLLASNSPPFRTASSALPGPGLGPGATPGAVVGTGNAPGATPRTGVGTGNAPGARAGVGAEAAPGAGTAPGAGAAGGVRVPSPRAASTGRVPSAGPQTAPRAYRPTGALHLAALIDARGPLAAERCADLVRLAERGGLDFVVLQCADDSALDALALPTRIAPATDRIGVLPLLAPNPAGADLARALAALDRLSEGRAGWAVALPPAGRPSAAQTQAPASAPGTRSRRRPGSRSNRKPPAAAAPYTPPHLTPDPVPNLWPDPTPNPAAHPPAGLGAGPRPGGAAPRAARPANAESPSGAATGAVGDVAAGAVSAAADDALAAVVDAVVDAWDTCTPSSGDARAARVRPVIAVDAGQPGPGPGLAARHADIAFVRAAGPEQAAAAGTGLRALAAQAGRDPDRLLVFADLAIDFGNGELGHEPGVEVGPVDDGAGGLLFRGGPVDLAELVVRWRESGAVDGFLVRPVDPGRDLERFVNGTVALLQHRGAFRTFHPGGTLREHLGLHRPAQPRTPPPPSPTPPAPPAPSAPPAQPAPPFGSTSGSPDRYGRLEHMTTQARDLAFSRWEQWRERRAASVTAPDGPLALTATHWLEDLQDGEAPDLPGRWREEDGDVVHETADGGRTVLHPEGGPLLLADGRKVAAIIREGVLGLRVWDAQSPARKAFAGIDAFAFDERWVVPGAFRAYDVPRPVRLPNADGRERDLALGGELTFTAAGVEHTLSVAIEDDGRLWAVIADGTSGKSTFRFRFLYVSAPAADGSATVDLNRAQLPPCAFADAFICPFPPPGNTLPYPLEAGERAVLTS